MNEWIISTMYKGISDARRIPLIIKEARLAKGLSQEELAERADVSTETVGKWERGLVAPTRNHREILIYCLDIEPEALGLLSQTDYTLDSAQLLIKNTELSLDMGDFMTALSTSAILDHNLTRQVGSGEVDLLASLCRAQYLIGHAISIAQNNPRLALAHFKSMKRLARQIDDKLLLCIALTYQGEMYRRMGEYDRAIRTIKRALQVPDVNAQIRGNAQQLLARSYRDKGDTVSVMPAMSEAEVLASGWEMHNSGIYVCFNPCSVYIDYARMYMKMGKIEQSLEYIAKSEKLENLGYIAQRWSPPILLTKGEILINAVVNTNSRASKSTLSEPDYLSGVALIEKGYLRAKELGHRRQVQHIFNLPQKFEQKGNFVVSYDLTERLFRLDKNREV
jgi:transcriptional regulator with XRE-family HTH domain